MRNSKRPLFLVLLVTAASWLTAQQNFSLYHMESLPQRSALNPALVPDCKWYVGFPGFNSLGVQVTNTGFNLKEINNAVEVSGGETLLNLNKLLNVFSKQNYLSLKADQTWVNFGFSEKKHFFTFGVTEKAGVKFGYPKDLFRFIIDGNGGSNLGETFDFRFSADAYHYREYGVGYAYRLTDKLTLGTKLKYLQGINRAELKDAYVKVRTRPEDYALEISGNYQLNVASSLGQIITADGSDLELDPRGFYKGIKNSGWGIDLGAEYTVMDKLKISASLIDLGYINWKQNATSIVAANPDATFVYDGFHISSSDTSIDPGKYFERIGDSLTGMFGSDTLRRSFRTALSTELMLGASYALRKNLKLNALFYGDVYNKRLMGGLTLGLFWRPVKMFSVNINNTFYGRAWLNPGICMAFNAGAVQAYLAAENFLAPFTPGSARGAAFRTGINLTFGRAKSRGTGVESPDVKAGGGKAAPIDPTSIQ
jgi:hypothetical protein